jgi:hypothetical protein
MSPRWEQHGEEQIETVSLGWTGRDVYVRVTDPRYRFSATWLDAADVTPGGRCATLGQSSISIGA